MNIPVEHKNTAGQIYGIDFLRFLAASLVMVYHLGFISWASPYAQTNIFDSLAVLTPFIGTGWVGVHIFFVISGFVIAYTANGASPLGFVNRRIARLAPTVWICATLSIPFLMIDGVQLQSIISKYFASLFFLPYLDKVASSYWTLSVEIVFYALILTALCVNLFRKIEFFAIILGAASSLMWALYYLQFTVPLGVVGKIAVTLGGKPNYAIFLMQHGVFFAIGLLAWLVSYSGWTSRRVASIGVFAVFGVLAIIAETAKSSAWTGVVTNSATPTMVFAASLILMAGSIKYNSYFASLFIRNAAWIKTLGLMTYPLYLIHEPVGHFVLSNLIVIGFPAIASLFAACLSAVSIALIVTIWLEPPLQSLARRLLKILETRMSSRFIRYGLPTTRV